MCFPDTWPTIRPAGVPPYGTGVRLPLERSESAVRGGDGAGLAPARLPRRTVSCTPDARGGCRALGVMEHHLAERRFFVAERYTVADIALYAYMHVADEGDFRLLPERPCPAGARRD